MIPSYFWFPTNFSERADWFDNFSTQFAIVAASLGLAAKVEQVADDNAVIQFLSTARPQIAAYDDAMREYQRIITEGNIGEPIPQIPASPVFSLPQIVPTGIYQRLVELRTQIMAADAYTDEVGTLLRIIPQKKPKPVPMTVKLKLVTHASATNYMFSAVVSNRGEADMWDLYILRKGAANWEKIGTFTGKSADVQLTPTTPGEAEQMQVRVQGRKNNQNYGQPSDPVYTTINP